MERKLSDGKEQVVGSRRQRLTARLELFGLNLRVKVAIGNPLVG